MYTVGGCRKARPAQAGKDVVMKKSDENKPLEGQISMFESVGVETSAQSCYIKSIQKGEEDNERKQIKQEGTD